MPVHAVALTDAVEILRGDAQAGERCFLSTPNLNFLIASQSNATLRDSVVMSHLSVADGMPLLWLARLLGVALPERVAGSDVFERLRSTSSAVPLKVFFFGGEGDAAQSACDALNRELKGLVGVGSLNPGFGDIASMSSSGFINQINASQADLLVVSIGAAKGQGWILQNLGALEPPVVSNLGAVVNFTAGQVARAPLWMQRLGLEWLWRIIEEPALWRRYFFDGLALLKLVTTKVIPYALWLRRRRPEVGALSKEHTPETASTQLAGSTAKALTSVEITATDGQSQVTLPPILDASNQSLLADALEPLIPPTQPIALDMAQVSYIDPAGLGLILWLEHHVLHAGNTLSLRNASADIRRVLCWNNMDHLLTD